MINNKQVNIWRGDSTPPTIYHVWIKDNSKLLLFNGIEWIIFLDNKDIIDTLQTIIDRVSKLENNTINGKKIKDNPVLTGDDINITNDGTYISKSDGITSNLLDIDALLTTQIIGK